MICAQKGYKCLIVMPQLPPLAERFLNCRKLGAEVHLTTPHDAVPSMIRYSKELVAKNENYWFADQFNNEANVDVHYATTGPEIWHQLDGKVDCLVSGLGTGGTLVGAGKFLKEQNAAVKLVA